MKLTRIAGIPVRLHTSFLWIALLYAGYSLMSSGVEGLFWTAVTVTTLFTSVLVHEFGHALVARRFGVDTAHITLYPFGGIAALKSEAPTPRSEAMIALAGPAVNGLIAVVSGVLWWATGAWFFGMLTLINGVMGVFNLLPAFPMDGGRVLRASLSPLLGWWTASRWAIAVGRAFAVLFLAVGALTWSPNLLIVGGFLLFASGMERRRLRALARRADPQSASRSVGGSARATKTEGAELRLAHWDEGAVAEAPYVVRWRLAPREQ